MQATASTRPLGELLAVNEQIQTLDCLLAELSNQL